MKFIISYISIRLKWRRNVVANFNSNKRKNVYLLHTWKKRKPFSVRKSSYELLTDYFMSRLSFTKNVSWIFGRVKALSVLPTLLHY